ncbi:hypothetical protein M5J20_05390, partial [Corynebacterium sp. TA-R-1]|nr:hypothetical protein [Corynebacterium stercoris]
VPQDATPGDGTVQIKDKDGNNVGDPIKVTITGPTGTTDAPGGSTGNLTGNTSDTPSKGSGPSKDTTTVDTSDVATIDPNLGEQGTNIKVDNASEQTKVVARDEDGQNVKAGIDDNGNIVVDPTKDANGNDIKVDGPITVTITDPSLPGGKTTVTVPVKDHVKGVDNNANGTPRPGSSSGLNGDIDAGRCAATAMGFGLPLLALIPLGLATQIDIPVVSQAVQQFNQQLQQVNTMIQQQMGVFNPQLAGQVDSLNAQLARVAPVAGGLALIAVGLLAGTLIYDACAPGGLGSSNH